MTKKVVPVIGAAGNVGRGIVEAFKNKGWEVLPIDPQINKRFQDLTDQEFRELLTPASFVVYAADCGNRDEYARRPELELENNKRFADFCQRVLEVNRNLIIWYVGGSWTKRKPDSSWIVNDESPNKDLKDCNPYEKAKISAQKNAEKLSRKIKIRFLDWASIVPNLAPNFSINRMVAQALEQGKISYSPGPYGRPLIEATQAGEALILLIENDDSKKRFAWYLIPGVFISFADFARIAKEVVEQNTGKKIVLEEIKETPDFLKSQSHSEWLNNLGFRPDKKRTLAALRANAMTYFKSLRG